MAIISVSACGQRQATVGSSLSTTGPQNKTENMMFGASQPPSEPVNLFAYGAGQWSACPAIRASKKYFTKAQ